MMVRWPAGLFAVGLSVALLATPAVAQDEMMIVWVDPDGAAYLKNNSATETIKLASYSIASESNDLV